MDLFLDRLRQALPSKSLPEEAKQSNKKQTQTHNTSCKAGSKVASRRESKHEIKQAKKIF